MGWFGISFWLFVNEGAISGIAEKSDPQKLTETVERPHYVVEIVVLMKKSTTPQSDQK